ncbi:hypothetical protein SPRG_02568 [Saprolegnia parasitica CBS 223.65]|uniref:RNA helicase n=1 Tax=Saprolegnia parasitica (strain CBS 223.65) TaxID=695850 RepID=A0A067D299_SAPPC|nr:hypothetical protein SPRG_02568 [Saprolegnia parasitica CBS 223.65]KDO32876.1 hypothetical protein SPRG_02568 [Saprolegnia parasitica CBS 223.65]|eukprot:XP_012196527.1 hypothetical protein SPRG_02568 [Saprolegnia parasitica CBS 223.65]
MAAKACVDALCTYVQARHGYVRVAELESFYSSTKARKKLKATVADAGGIEAFIAAHGASAAYPLAVVAHAIQFAATSEAIKALGEAALPNRTTTDIGCFLGGFRKAHPAYGFMWSSAKIASCTEFIEIHGCLGQFQLVIVGDKKLLGITWTQQPGSPPPTTSPSASTTATPPAAYKYITTVQGAKQAFAVLKQSDVLFMDLEGDLEAAGKMSLLQVSCRSDCVYILDVYVCPAILREPEIVAVLTSKLAVLHDARHDYTGLAGQFNLRLTNLFDTQVAHQVLTSSPNTLVGLNKILHQYAGAINTQKDSVQHGFGLWDRRPIEAQRLDYAAQDVKHLPAAYARMKSLMTTAMYNEVLAKSLARAQLGAVPQGAHDAIRRLGKYIVSLGGKLRFSNMGDYYTKHPNDKGVFKPSLAAFLRTHGPQASPPILVDNDFAWVENDSKPLTVASVLKIVGGFIAENGGRIPGSRLGDLYKEYPGISAVIYANGSNASGFVKDHGASATPPIRSTDGDFFVGGASHEAASPANDPSPAKLLKLYGAKFTADKYGVEIKDNNVFRRVVETKTSATQLYTVTSRATESITLRRVFQVATSKGSTPFKFGPKIGTNIAFAPNTTLNIPCHFSPKVPGQYKTILAFEFVTRHGTVFFIGRVVEGVNAVDAGMDAETRDAIASAPVKRQRRKKRTNLHFVPPTGGDKHSAKSTRSKRSVPLAPYPVPSPLPVVDFEGPLSLVNYQARFRHLLFHEELEHLRQQAEFDMDGARLKVKTPDLYELAVPGLAEGRPSLMTGDKVWLSRGAKTFQGTVYDVRLDAIYIATPTSFRSAYQASASFNVRFIMSRTPMREMHQGLASISLAMHETLLFPSPTVPRPVEIQRSLQPTRSINPEQHKVINDVLDHVMSSAKVKAPYLLFGPPGTGKTVTLVETIVQLLRAKPDAKILVCAPSNAAADNVVERLASQLTRAKLLRAMAFSRREKGTPDAVLPFTKTNGEGGFTPVTLGDVQAVAVIVSTIGSGAKLYNLGVARGYFSLIAIDEAAQASEPEVVTVLGPLALPATVVVLAGDPKQLGPVVKSAVAAKHGLGMSLMERLMERELYATSHKTKLLRNYRSHDAILTVPNELFYEGELTPHAPKATTHNMLAWPSLPNAAAPILFHGITGAEMQDADSPSWYNLFELHAVLTYIQSLKTYPGLRLDEIGVITPYAKQRQKIQMALQKHKLDGVLVGSVEQFQGGERRVILVSTVRSSTEFFADDAKFRLGFVSHPKRFNVAITRAKALLIVVGNPDILETSSTWGPFLEHCVRLGAIAGAPPRHATAIIKAERANDSGNDSDADDDDDDDEYGGNDSDDDDDDYDSDDDVCVQYEIMMAEAAAAHRANVQAEAAARAAQVEEERAYQARLRAWEDARARELAPRDQARRRDVYNAVMEQQYRAQLEHEERMYRSVQAQEHAAMMAAQEAARQAKHDESTSGCSIQ